METTELIKQLFERILINPVILVSPPSFILRYIHSYMETAVSARYLFHARLKVT